MKQTTKQLKRLKKREFKQQKKANRIELQQEIKQLLDQKEANTDNTPENQEALEEIWNILKNLEKLSNKDLKTKLEELKQ